MQETVPRVDEYDRRKQTSYESFSTRRVNLPDPSKDKPTWARTEPIREFLSQEETAKQIERLGVEGLGVKEQERVVRAANQPPPEIDVGVETESGNNDINQANTRARWGFHNNINQAGTRTWWGSYKTISQAGTRTWWGSNKNIDRAHTSMSLLFPEGPSRSQRGGRYLGTGVPRPYPVRK